MVATSGRRSASHRARTLAGNPRKRGAIARDGRDAQRRGPRMSKPDKARRLARLTARDVRVLAERCAGDIAERRSKDPDTAIRRSPVTRRSPSTKRLPLRMAFCSRATAWIASPATTGAPSLLALGHRARTRKGEEDIAEDYGGIGRRKVLQDIEAAALRCMRGRGPLAERDAALAVLGTQAQCEAILGIIFRHVAEAHFPGCKGQNRLKSDLVFRNRSSSRQKR